MCFKERAFIEVQGDLESSSGSFVGRKMIGQLIFTSKVIIFGDQNAYHFGSFKNLKTMYVLPSPKNQKFILILPSTLSSFKCIFTKVMKILCNLVIQNIDCHEDNFLENSLLR